MDRKLKNNDFPYPVFIEPDTIEAGRTDSLLWYHRVDTSERSVWADTLKAQGLEDYMKQSSDPLHNLTFGALVTGAGMAAQSSTLLKSTAPAARFDISVHTLTDQTATAREWTQKAESMAAST